MKFVVFCLERVNRASACVRNILSAQEPNSSPLRLDFTEINAAFLRACWRGEYSPTVPLVVHSFGWRNLS